MHKKQFAINFALIGWAIFNLLFWQTASSWQNVDIKHNIVNSESQFIHGLTLLGIDLLFIWLGRQLTKKRFDYHQIIQFLIKTWLMVFGTSFLMMVVEVLNHQFNRQIFYQTLLPLGQNTSPLLTGLLLGIILLKITDELSTVAIPWLKLTLWVMLFLPTLGGHDLFSWTSGNNPLLYAVLIVLGSLASRQSRKRLSIIGILSLIIGLACLIVMPITAMLLNEINGTQLSPSRMTNTANAFLVLFAWAIVNIVSRPQTSDNAALSWHSLYWTSLALFISQYPLTSSLFTSIANHYSGFGPKCYLVSA